MWRPEQGHGACSGGSSNISKQQASPEVTISTFQHPALNPTPFSTFPTAWVIGTTTAPDGSLPSRLSGNPPSSSIVHAPSDLLPQGLLVSPQPSTPATTLLKVLVNNRVTIPGQDAAYIAANGAVVASPAKSGGAVLRQLDSLVLPSPSLLPGGVHSLPTPTSSTSLPVKHNDGYGSRGSPHEPATNKDSKSGPIFDNYAAEPARPTSGEVNRRADAAQSQYLSQNGSGGAGSSSSSSSAAGSARAVDASSSSTGNGGQFHGSHNAQQPSSGSSYRGYGSADLSLQSSNGGFPFPQYSQASKSTAAITAAMSQPPCTQAAAYSPQHYYMAQMPAGTVVFHHTAGNGGGGAGANTRSSNGGGYSGVPSAARDGSSGSSGWRGIRNAGGSGSHSFNVGVTLNGAVGGAGQGSKSPGTRFAHQQQLVQGHMVHDGAGAFGMTHMHPAPYAVYGMMAPGVVMPQVLSSVVGAPHGLEAHGTLGHQAVHMGPMVMSHGASMGMGMGVGHHISAFPHIGMHPHAHLSGPAHGTFAHLHYHAGLSGGYGSSQQPHVHTAGSGLPPHGGQHASSRSGGGKGASAGGAQQSGKKSGAGAGAAGGGEAGGGGAIGTAGSAKDSRAVARGRREKAKARAEELRERKPGNSRAPAIIAQCIADMPSLEQQLQFLVQQLTPGADELKAYQVALTAVRELVLERWPHVKVHLFGSAANGLSVAGSNEMDITIEVADMLWDDHAAKAAMVSELGILASGVEPPAPAAAMATTPSLEAKADTEPCEKVAADAVVVSAEVVEATVAAEGSDAPAPDAEAEATAPASPASVEPEQPREFDDSDAGGESTAPEDAEPRPPPPMAAVSALPKARTPVVKMMVPSTQTRVNVTINNLLAISNTRMVGHYCEVDPRLRQLALFVKHWARTRSVNDAYRGSLSSYAYVMLCIWLLQQRQPAILPVLQQREPHTYNTTVGPWRCSYNDRIEEVKDFGAGNKETLAQLLIAFFDHWAWRHDYNGSVVCVRTGGVVTKASKEWTKRQGNERHLMCIEDPFELSHDLGRTIDKAAVQVLRREFERAARIFASNPDPLPELLAPLTPEEEATVAAALQSRRKASKEKGKEKKERQAAAAAAAGVAAAAGGDSSGADCSATEAGAADVSGDGSRPVSELGSDGEDDGPGNGQRDGL